LFVAALYVVGEAEHRADARYPAWLPSDRPAGTARLAESVPMAPAAGGR
jgi:hypothetical protein